MSKNAMVGFFVLEILGVSLSILGWYVSPASAKVDPLERRVAALELQVQKLTIAIRKPAGNDSSFKLGKHTLGTSNASQATPERVVRDDMPPAAESWTVTGDGTVINDRLLYDPAE